MKIGRGKRNRGGKLTKETCLWNTNKTSLFHSSIRRDIEMRIRKKGEDAELGRIEGGGRKNIKRYSSSANFSVQY